MTRRTDEIFHVVVLIDPDDCGRKLAPYLRTPGGRVIRKSIAPNGIRREAALFTVPRAASHIARKGKGRRTPAAAMSVRRRAPAVLRALPALITDLLGTEGQERVVARATAALLRFPGIYAARIVLYKEYRTAPRREGFASVEDPYRLGRFRNTRRHPPLPIAPGLRHAALSLFDNRTPIGFVDLAVSPDALLPPTRGALLAAGRSITSAVERERSRTHMRRLHFLHARRTAELSAEIAERRRTEEKLGRFMIAIEQSGDSVFITDTKGVIRYVNKAFETITGYTREEAIDHTPRILRSGRHARAFYDNMWHTIRSGSVYRDMFINRRKDGSLYYEQATITPLRDESGAITYFVSTGKDMTEHIATEERINYLAHHDPLTNLPTHALLSERIDAAIVQDQYGNRSLAVLLFDLDRFQRVNDTFGPLVGDRIVQEFAERLRAALGRKAFVARLGGDEFAALLAPMRSVQEASIFADHLAALVSEPFNVSGHEFFLTVSIGVSLAPTDGADAETLLKNAGSALDRAKLRGGNAHEFYTADMNAKALERLTLESRLRRALERDELRLFYQPQKDMVSGRIVGAEALMRWQQSDGALVSPAGFIPLLEETGLIVPAGEWALQTALAQMEAWRAQGLWDVRVSVNISARQFRDRALLAVLADILGRWPHSEGLLELELTESVLMENAQGAVDMLEALSDMGIRLAVDDFGTGYSSLSYLKRFPLNALKIDQSFVADLTRHTDGGAITRAIITLGHELGLDIIAEGVETEDQMSFLRRQHCDLVQGYLVAHPLSGPAVAELLRAQT